MHTTKLQKQKEEENKRPRYGDPNLIAVTQTIVKRTPRVHAHKIIPSTRSLLGTSN
jgi:hypothetical protein